MTFCHVLVSGMQFVNTIKEHIIKLICIEDLILNEVTFSEANVHHWYETGRRLFDDNKQKTMAILNNYALNEGVLDSSKMQSDWFPQINSHIFISHFHKDEEIAITLSGWLYETFGLIAFIDSGIWRNANDLLKIIDNKYCFQPDGHYSYEKRNYSTSHIHMMLLTVLTQMIDKPECLFSTIFPSLFHLQV